ncbi:MAG: anti-sigma factor family protein [Pyrinomonadaceae bacterium]
MVSSNLHSNSGCPSHEISAYIDGELSPAEERHLESHMARCSNCTVELNSQKQFLFVLDFSLENTDVIVLPENFTRSVVAHAESRVGGLRRRAERRKAVLVCAALLLISLVALGSDFPTVFAAVGIILDKVMAIAAFAGHSFLDVSLAAVFVLRTFTSAFIFGSTFSVGLLVIAFAAALFGFSRLLGRNSRA